MTSLDEQKRHKVSDVSYDTIKNPEKNYSNRQESELRCGVNIYAAGAKENERDRENPGLKYRDLIRESSVNGKQG
ncbi:MAG: hypothetical protein ASARMPREDX12_007991 [Alectoria sarmentosa]|nr:MAG: hypothetical protein ASARMPREDX12_007991 [Alectoria sarmentosa]